MTAITRGARFWIAYALLALGALVVAARLFPSAIPLLNLEIRVSADEAIAKARAAAAERGVAPAQVRAAAQFAHDGALQDYVELEAGGKPAFAALVAGTRYAPYRWSVRLFRPGVVDEATIRVRPDGALDGFARRLPEDYVRDPATMAMPAAAARERAEALAARDWNVDFARYRLLQQSQETRPKGRVDHQFVYEEPEPIGEATVRLRVGLAGDELTEVVPFVRIPESFTRRFEAMRSANRTIAGAAAAAAGLLYGVGGCIVGVLWLLRRRWLLWRPALAAGFVVSALLAGAVLAAYPSQWATFDTANDASLFWIRHVVATLGVLVGAGLALGLVFMAAESLSRLAFPGHPQLWKLWSRDAGATVQTLGRTVGGYLFVPVELAFVVLFYYATNRWLGWWQPSESLTDPNILSSAVPALQPIAMALEAGFMEECLFRAVPLAIGALVGARFGARNAGIAIALVLQSIVFAAAHASYPGLPSYTRLAELVLPAMAWGLVFLRFGLLPTILLHAVFDLVLMAIPIFLLDAPGAGLQRALVVAAGVLPLAVVLGRRLRRGAWNELPASLWNGAWRPDEPARVAATTTVAAAEVRWRATLRRLLPALGVAGLVLVVLSSRVGSDAPPLAIGRAQAIAAAGQALAGRGVAPGASWQSSADILLSGEDAPHTFVWREAGADRYRELVGRVLAPPLWIVRFARFDGDVAERAEEWRVGVDGEGRVRNVNHRLPEGRPGARLARDEALAVAAKAVRDELGVDTSALRLVAAEDQVRPARTDWTFVWHDPGIDVGPGGEARVGATVKGDEAGAATWLVNVPEAWIRAERQREQWLGIARIAAAVVVAAAALAAFVIGVVAWSRGRSDRRASLVVGGIVVVAGIARIALAWPEQSFRLSTTDPVAAQVALKLAGQALAVLVLALASALVAGVGAWWARSTARRPFARPGRAGVAAALAMAGLAAASSRFVPDLAPSWPRYAFEGTAVPWLAAALQPASLPASIGLVLFALAALAHFTAEGTRRAWLLPVLLALVFGIGSLGAATFAPAPVLAAMAVGIAAAVLIDAVPRADPRAAPAFVATVAVLSALEEALAKATPRGYALFVMQAIGTIVVAAACARHLARPLPLQGEATPDVLAPRTTAAPR